MIGWLLRATFTTVILGAVGYLIVSVPIGRRTLFEHGLAIYRTQPAQELAEDVGEAASAAVARVKGSLEQAKEP